MGDNTGNALYECQSAGVVTIRLLLVHEYPEPANYRALSLLHVCVCFKI